MNTNTSHKLMHPRDTQRGFVMVTVLVMMLLLLLFVGYVAQVGNTEQAVVALSQDNTYARANARLALIDAERDILGIDFKGTYCRKESGDFNGDSKCGSDNTARPKNTRPTKLNDSVWQASNLDDVLSKDLNQGLYHVLDANDCNRAMWESANWEVFDLKCGTRSNKFKTVEYGSYTGAIFDQQGVRKPRYLIEAIKSSDADSNKSISGDELVFRITAIGFGRGASRDGIPNHVFLQELFIPYSTNFQ